MSKTIKVRTGGKTRKIYAVDLATVHPHDSGFSIGKDSFSVTLTVCLGSIYAINRTLNFEQTFTNVMLELIDHDEGAKRAIRFNLKLLILLPIIGLLLAILYTTQNFDDLDFNIIELLVLGSIVLFIASLRRVSNKRIMWVKVNAIDEANEPVEFYLGKLFPDKERNTTAILYNQLKLAEKPQNED